LILRLSFSALGSISFSKIKCAEKAKADYIVTRNIKDFKTASIKVGTPEDFLEDFINQY
jgi:hypothetical protein